MRQKNLFQFIILLCLFTVYDVIFFGKRRSIEDLIFKVLPSSLRLSILISLPITASLACYKRVSNFSRFERIIQIFKFIKTLILVKTFESLLKKIL
ncbi:hypothetical protein BpHYR1_041658 [Brachionus plicatilis]|uniref:Uncharacterized protein n=1 Tax=Brachionus plicatilis TaxID=10195 RepID=A0A3M7ST04_BRAPC|nr:hypothetical protein BpHYR1_041658 [Brachionus plicatilis]